MYLYSKYSSIMLTALLHVHPNNGVSADVKRSFINYASLCKSYKIDLLTEMLFKTGTRTATALMSEIHRIPLLIQNLYHYACISIVTIQIHLYYNLDKGSRTHASVSAGFALVNAQ